MQIIPALDLLGNDAVRLERGDYNKVIFRHDIDDLVPRIVATDPSLLHIVDLQGSRDGKVRLDIIERCAQLAGHVPLQVSGGIRSVADAQRLLDHGVHRVIVGTAAWAAPNGLETFVAALGERLVVAVDVRQGQVVVRGWLDNTGLTVEAALEHCQRAGVARLHVTAIDRDGTMSGPNLALYELVCRAGIPVVAAGGVRDDADVDALAAIGCEAAVMGVGYLRRLGLALATPEA